MVISRFSFSMILCYTKSARVFLWNTYKKQGFFGRKWKRKRLFFGVFLRSLRRYFSVSLKQQADGKFPFPLDESGVRSFRRLHLPLSGKAFTFYHSKTFISRQNPLRSVSYPQKSAPILCNSHKMRALWRGARGFKAWIHSDKSGKTVLIFLHYYYDKV